MVAEAGDLTSLREAPRSPGLKEAGAFPLGLTPYGRMPRNDSARPELPYCGRTTSAIREGPKLSPARSGAFSSRTLGTLGDGPYLGLGSDVAPYDAFLSPGLVSGLFLRSATPKGTSGACPSTVIV